MELMKVHISIDMSAQYDNEQVDMREDRNLATGKVDEKKSLSIPLPEGDAWVRFHLLDGGSFTAGESRMHANAEVRSFFPLYAHVQLGVLGDTYSCQRWHPS